MKAYLSKISFKRILIMILGIVIIAIGVASLRISGFGTDPYACLNFGVSALLSMSYGTFLLILNIILFIPVIILYPKSFGIGALFNMVCAGYIIDSFLWLAGLMGVTVESMAGLLFVRIILLIVGVLAICLGIAIYMECDLGAAPYDVIGEVVEIRTQGKIKFKWVRMTTDIVCVAIGFWAGGTVGVATVITAFFTGPVVSWFKVHVAKKLVAQS